MANPKRAKAMKSSHHSLKSKCTTSHSAQLKARIEEALSRNVRTVPVRVDCKLVDVCLATLVPVRGETDGEEFSANSGQPQIAVRL